MTYLAKGYSGIVQALGGLSALILSSLVVVIAGEVFARAMWNITFPWLTEISEYGLFVATFSGAPYVLLHNGHVRFELLLNPNTRRGTVLLVFSYVIGAVVSLFLVIYGVRASVDAYLGDVINFNYFVTPEWWLLAVIPISGMLMCAEFIRRIYGSWRLPLEKVGR